MTSTSHQPGSLSDPFDDVPHRRDTTASDEAVDEKHQHTHTHVPDLRHTYAAQDLPLQTWKGKIWDTLDKPPKERKMLFKVDAVILTFASLGYFLKNLDQTNINSAFVSGMKEDLGMYGEELVTAVSIWTVGYVLGQIPSNLLLTRVSPRWVIPALELGWGIATLGSFAVKDVKSLYALRFLVGLFEAGFYPGIHYLLGGWYTPREIGKRAMIFWLAGSLGQMFSGKSPFFDLFLLGSFPASFLPVKLPDPDLPVLCILQSAAYTNLNHVHGLAGWRWLFIIDAIITLPIAILGFVFFPPLPLQDAKPWWLTPEEFGIAQDRLKSVGRAGKTPWSWPKVRRLALDWHCWVLPIIYVLWNNAWPQPPVAYWLKAFNNPTNPPRPGTTFTVQQINQLPLPQTAIHVTASLICAWLSDGLLNGNRSIFIYTGAVGQIIFAAILRQRDIFGANITGTLVLYWFSTVSQNAGPLILTWINEICSTDTEKRALLVAFANDFAYVVQAVAPNFVWKTTEFPKATKGWTWVIVLCCLLILWTAMTEYLLARDRKRGLHGGQPIRSSADADGQGIAGDRNSSRASDEEAYAADGVGGDEKAAVRQETRRAGSEDEGGSGKSTPSDTPSLERRVAVLV